MVRVLIFRIRIEVATSAFKDEPCSYSFELLVKDSFSLNLWSPESHAMSCIAQSFDNSPAGHLVHLFGSLLLFSLFTSALVIWSRLLNCCRESDPDSRRQARNGMVLRFEGNSMGWFEPKKKSRIAVILEHSSISLQDGHNKLVVSSSS